LHVQAITIQYSRDKVSVLCRFTEHSDMTLTGTMGRYWGT